MSSVSISRQSTAYPALLRELTDAPSHLYLRKGEPELLSRPSVAIVGARSCSAYGAQVARMLGRELAGAGLVVVSGEITRAVRDSSYDGGPIKEGDWLGLSSKSIETVAPTLTVRVSGG